MKTISTAEIISKYKDFFSDGQRSAMKKLLRSTLHHIPFGRRDLELLALKHDTNKRDNGFTSIYQNYFEPIRTKRLNILEIGVGGYKDPRAGGASLRMWQEYFPKSMVYGIDVFDKHLHNDKRIKVFKGSQNDPRFLESVATKIGQFDIVIDDGSHINEHVVTSFNTLFPFLSDDGIYVIEDLCTSYWPDYGGSWEDLNDPTTTMSLLKGLVDGLTYKEIPNRTTTYFDKNIVAVHFYPNIAFVFKGGNR